MVVGRLYKRLKLLAKRLLLRDPWFFVQVRRAVQRHGSECNGWNICPSNISAESVIYSFGVGEDVSFDLSLAAAYGAKVHAFDPTPKSIKWFKSNVNSERICLFEYGVAAYDGNLTVYPPQDPSHVSHSLVKISDLTPITIPVCNLKTIMRCLGHSHVDILKLDVEGAEYQVIDFILDQGISVDQLLVEFHHRLPSISPQETVRIVRKLNASGYKIFAISDDGQEFSFIRQKDA